MKKVFVSMLVAAMALALTSCNSATNTATSPTPAGTAAAEQTQTIGWTPGKTVEVVVPNDAGGGTDIFARKVVEIINNNKFAEGTVFTVVNKGGGSGTIGGSYVLGKKGDNNTIIFGSTAFWTTPISGKAEYSYSDFTPLVEMSQDVLVLAVGKVSGIDSIDQFIEKAKSADGAVSLCGTSLISEGGLLNFALQNEVGCTTKWVPYDSSSEAITAVMGGHVTATWANYGEITQQIQSGDIKVLATATAERMKELPDTPTMKELGYSIEIVQHRHIAGAPGMSVEAAQYYSDLFEKVYNTPEFAEYAKLNALTPHFYGLKEWTEKYAEIGADYEKLVAQAMAASNS